MHALSNVTFLVTGGAGFIGSNLVRALVERGARGVRVFDNFSTGRRRNLESMLSSIELVEGDLRNAAEIREAVEGVDFILHEGAIPSVPRSVENPLLTTAVNVDGTANLLSAAVRSGVRRVVFASSSSIYGNTDGLAKHEELPLVTLSPYASSKGAGELMCQSFFRSLGLETVCLRYFNVFGPHQDPRSTYAAVIPRFISALQRGEPLPIFGDGMQTRDFTYVDNVVEANLLACQAPSVAGRCFNVACGHQVSLLELARCLAEIMGRRLELHHLPGRAGDVRHSLADISRARRELGYEPRVGLTEGLRHTVEHFVTREVTV